MRRLTGWLTGIAGGLAAYRFLTRRRPAPAEVLPEAPDPRAEALRAKLAERPEEPAPEPEAPAEPEDPAERRRRVHETGQAALDEMRGGGSDAAD